MIRILRSNAPQSFRPMSLAKLRVNWLELPVWFKQFDRCRATLRRQIGSVSNSSCFESSPRRLRLVRGSSCRAQVYPAAIEHYQEAIRLNKRFVEAHVNLGSVFVKTERYDDAMREFRRALKIDPGFRPARQNLDRVEAFLGNRRQ